MQNREKFNLKQVWSLSEDQTLVIYDRAAGKKLKKVLNSIMGLLVRCVTFTSCVQVPLPGSHFPICMSGQGNCLWVGDKGGNLHLVDTTNDAFEVKAVLSSLCAATYHPEL